MSLWVKGSGPANSPWPWLTKYDITQPYGVHGETGIDIGTPMHTAINALVGGVVVGSGYYGGGGVVATETTIAGKTAVVYYQHLDLISSNIQLGQRVNAGDYLGLSGGQLAGGYHPSSTRYSNGPHTEIGINPPYGSLWNPHHITPGYDPLPWIRATVQAGRTGPAGAGTNGPLGSQPGFIPMLQALDDAMRFHSLDNSGGLDGPVKLASSMFSNIYPFMARTLFVLLGLAIMVAVIWHVVKPAAEQALDLESQLVGDAAKAAPLAML
jgi:hypothetical protein